MDLQLKCNLLNNHLRPEKMRNTIAASRVGEPAEVHRHLRYYGTPAILCDLQ
jgi:hypothetical protein